MFHVVFRILLIVIVSFSGLLTCTSVGEERVFVFAIDYLKFCGFSSNGFHLPLGAWGGLHYFIVALPGSSKNHFVIVNSY